MMYIHYCAACNRIHMLNGHKQHCPRCEQQLAELKIDYLTYASYDDEKRSELLLACAKPEQLEQLKTTYRMYKYSKWYKQSCAEYEYHNSCNNT